MSDATAQTRRIAEGEVSPPEAVAAAIERAEALNPQANVIVADTFETATARAASADLDQGPLRGVPILMKDLGGPVLGDPAPNGNRVLAELGVRHDHTGAVGRRFRAAGTVSIGRSHSPEFGSGNCPAASETDAFGPTPNPWDPTRTAMGSSGGSASAVARGIVAAAHATDGGGSIRMPASACGLVGLKPGRGRVSNAPASTGWGGGVTEGALARSVRDAALLLDVLAGPEPGDDFSAPAPDRPYLDSLESPGPLRCGVLASVPYAETDPACLEATRSAAELLAGLGHRVDADAHPVALDSLDYLYDYITVIRTSGSVALRAVEHHLGRPWEADDMEDGTWVNHQRGLRVGAVDYAMALERLHGFTSDVVSWWDDHDLLITPTLATPPPPLGYLVEGDDRQRRDRLGATMPFTAQFNVTGQPAISLPLHWTADGLPIGVQLVAAPFREDLLLQVAAQLEAAQPWIDRYPDLAF